MTEPPAEPPPPEEAAAALALGVLEGEELVQAQRRRLADPAFARAVEHWEARLAGLAEEVAPVPPSATLWTRIASRLGDERDEGEQVVALRLRRSLGVWRAAAVAAAGLAACLAVALVRPAPPPAPVLAARLAPSAGAAAAFVALYDSGRGALVLTPTDGRAQEGRSPELWLIPPGGRPVALGVGDFTASARFASDRSAPSLLAGLLAVSSEPEGGSPTGQPTGPVIASGRLTRL